MLERRRFLAAAATLACGTRVSSAAEWPERDITLTVMYGAGGNTDLMTRLVARHLEDALGKPVVVLNKVGAMGTLGPEYVSRQKPDGYNLGIVTASTIALAPHLVPVRFTLNDFEYGPAFANPRFGVAVQAESPYRSMTELIDAGRSGKVFFASGAALNSLIISSINQAAKTRFEIVNYKSGAEVSLALLSGQVTAILGNPADILPHVPSGKMRLLASASPARWPEQPNVPSIRDLGIEADAESWTAVAAPRGTPREIMRKVEAALLAITQKAEFRDALSKMGNDPLSIPGVEFEARVRRRAVEWGEALKKADLMPK